MYLIIGIGCVERGKPLVIEVRTQIEKGQSICTIYVEEGVK